MVSVCMCGPWWLVNWLQTCTHIPFLCPMTYSPSCLCLLTMLIFFLACLCGGVMGSSSKDGRLFVCSTTDNCQKIYFCLKSMTRWDCTNYIIAFVFVFAHTWKSLVLCIDLCDGCVSDLLNFLSVQLNTNWSTKIHACDDEWSTVG